MKITVSIIALWLCVPALGQTSLADYRAAVAGVVNVAVDDNCIAPIEYYNIQGLRVSNPDKGLYIRRQGSKVSKIVIR